MLFWVVPHLLNGLSLFVHNSSSNSALIWSYLSWPINFTLSPVATQQASRSSCMQMRVDFYSIGLRLIYFLCCVHNRLSFRGWIAHVLFSKKLRKSMRLQFLNLCKFDLRSIYYCTSFFFLFFFILLIHCFPILLDICFCLPFFLSGMFGLCRMLEKNVWHYIMINHLYHFFMKCLSTATRYIQIFSAQFLQNLAGIKPKKTLSIRKFVWQMFTSEEIHSFLVLKWNFLVWKTKPAGDRFTEFVWLLCLIQSDYNPNLF